MGEPLFLGIDIGSTTIKAAVCTRGGQVRDIFILPTRGRPMEVLDEVIQDVMRAFPGENPAAAVTGIGKALLQSCCTVAGENEIVATVRGIGLLPRRAASLIEVGGQFSKSIHLDRDGAVLDYSTNDLCAAGSGTFLEQQASRLHMAVETLARLAAEAPRGATIAGRCSVFAKSDMIHLQQKGTPVEELTYGLCLALARNFSATILRGRDLNAPVAFLGGGAANLGLVRAFREILRLGPDELFVPDHFRHLAALGACLVAEEASETANLCQLEQALRDRSSAPASARARLRPLAEARCGVPREEPVGLGAGDLEAFLGVDVGSVSTDLALVTPQGEVIDSVYLPTRGRPIEVLKEGLQSMKGRYDGRLRVLGVGTTGSGRHLAGSLLGSDVIKNEITAQMASAAAHFPEVDTIFEIGGQDSKFIRVSDGKVCDFTMNKVCAAGTGSFLEEQAERLGIRIIGEFAELAMASGSPADLGNRCTVFMDSELTFAQQRGVPVTDIAAGLAYAIAKNYLERVVAGRAIGKHIVFQGGVASNRAVVAAFENILDRTIRVHPYNRISGAIGAALLAHAGYVAHPQPSRFRGFDACGAFAVKSFDCKKCPNRCQVNRFAFADRVVYFGDACERYSNDGGEKVATAALPDLFAEREGLCLMGLDSLGQAGARGAVGIPRATLFFELLPLWARFFQELGCRVMLSPPSSSALLADGLRKLPVETCLPIKTTFGHVLALAERGADFIFLPSLRQLASPGRPDRKDLPCVYSEHVPYMVKAALQAPLLTPQIPLNDDVEETAPALYELAAPLGVSRAQIKEAFSAAYAHYEQFVRELECRGRAILAGKFDRAFVILGRPYNLYDPFQNLNLSRHLRRLNTLTIPVNFLPLSEVELGSEWDELVWKFSRDCIRAATLIHQDRRLFPIVVSSFGCGPDGFTLKSLEKLFAGRPCLFLEFDEHRGEAGLITRLEAFADEVEAYQRARSRPQLAPQPLLKLDCVAPESTVFIPRFADHAYAFAGAFRSVGHAAHVLPSPDEEAVRLGHAVSTGRECHPYVLVTSDLIALSRSGRARSGDVFFFPGTSEFPCLVSQYRAGCRHLLNDLGIDGLEVHAPGMVELFKFFGVNRGTRLWQGLLAIDLLGKLTCEKRPYEVHPGECDRVHQANLEEIEEGVASGRIVEAMRECVGRMSAVAVRDEPLRPLIGVAGDIYTRVNEFSNDQLFARLEAMGCEVWPAPFLVDNIDFIIRQGLDDSLAGRRFSEAFGDAMILALEEFFRAKVRNTVAGVLRNPDEPPYREVLRLAAPYADARANFVLLLNIAKMIDFARKGADGVVNAMGFNCMIGTVSAAMLRKIRHDHGNVPMVNLVYGESESAAQRSRLEAFVYQVKRQALRSPAKGRSGVKAS